MLDQLVQRKIDSASVRFLSARIRLSRRLKGLASVEFQRHQKVAYRVRNPYRTKHKNRYWCSTLASLELGLTQYKSAEVCRCHGEQNFFSSKFLFQSPSELSAELHPECVDDYSHVYPVIELPCERSEFLCRYLPHDHLRALPNRRDLWVNIRLLGARLRRGSLGAIQHRWLRLHCLHWKHGKYFYYHNRNASGLNSNSGSD